MSDDIVEAWHWTDKGKLRGGLDLPAKGEWLEHFGEVKICESGLHAAYAARQIVRETMKARLIELFNENAT